MKGSHDLFINKSLHQCDLMKVKLEEVLVNWWFNKFT